MASSTGLGILTVILSLRQPTAVVENAGWNSIAHNAYKLHPTPALARRELPERHLPLPSPQLLVFRTILV